mgnify:CR=1 FL=1
MYFFNNYNDILSIIRDSIRNYLSNNQLKSVVLGMSGGIDSALVASIVKPVCDELNIPLIGRSITIESNKGDEIDRSIKTGLAFCKDFDHIDLSIGYRLVIYDINRNNFKYDSDNFSSKIRNGNVKARLRMLTLYNLASLTGGIVMGTENLTEHYLGFFTIGGDEVSDFEPIKYLWKTEVYNLAEWMVNNDLKTNIEKEALQECIDANATDGLGISNTDLDQILPDWRDRHSNTRSGYKEVDEIFIKLFTSDDNTFKELKNHPVIQRYLRSDFKRKRPICIEREKFK